MKSVFQLLQIQRSSWSREFSGTSKNLNACPAQLVRPGKFAFGSMVIRVPGKVKCTLIILFFAILP